MLKPLTRKNTYNHINIKFHQNIKKLYINFHFNYTHKIIFNVEYILPISHHYNKINITVNKNTNPKHHSSKALGRLHYLTCQYKIEERSHPIYDLKFKSLIQEKLLTLLVRWLIRKSTLEHSVKTLDFCLTRSHGA